jgi:hypothetical protein
MLRAAEEADVGLRVLGGVAIGLRTPIPDALAREYGDLDFVAARGSSSALRKLFVDAGYEEDQAFNTLNGARRLIFLGGANRRKADVFVGQFEMCHKVPVGERLVLEPETLPLAELLLTKLQIVELTEKDSADLHALLAAHEVAEGPGDAIDAARVAAVLADDWGYWRTATGTLDRVASAHPELQAKTDAVRARIDAEPKTRRYKLRARIGERRRWYELPETIGG